MKKQNLLLLALAAGAVFAVYHHNGGAPLLGKQPKKTAAPGKAAVLKSPANSPTAQAVAKHRML